MPALQRLEARAQPSLDRERALEEPLVAIGVHGGEARRDGERMSAERVSARQRLVVEEFRERFAHGDAAERYVRGRHAFRKREDVGRYAEALRGERGAGASEAGHHLVEDQQNAVPVADLAHARQIAVRIEHDAVRADDRFDQQRRDAVAAFVHDDIFEVRDRAIDFFGGVARVKRTAIRKRRKEAHDAGHAGLVGPAAILAAQRTGSGSRSVKRAIRGEHLVPSGDRARELDRVFVGFAAAGREEDGGSLPATARFR